MEEIVFSIDPSLDKSMEIDVPGWEHLTIDYSTDIYAGISYLCWKIRGTEQLFKIHHTIVFEHHGLEYSEHFVLTLTNFREDYLKWEEEEFPLDWMKRYQSMFKNLIKH